MELHTYADDAPPSLSWSSRRIVVMLALGAAVLAAIGFGIWSAWDDRTLLAWKRDASPLVFFTGMAIAPLIGVPMTPLFVIAGATFGVSLGLAGSAAALALNLTLSFWIARSRLRPLVEGALRRTRYTLPDLEESPERALRFAILTKLAPGLPFFIKHYVLALAGVPFATYFLVAFGISGLYAASLIVLGESLFKHELARVVGAIAILLGLGLGVAWWQRRSA